MSTGMKVTEGCWARLWLLCPTGGGTASLEDLGSSSRRTRMRLAKVKGELAPGLVSPLPGWVLGRFPRNPVKPSQDFIPKMAKVLPEHVSSKWGIKLPLCQPWCTLRPFLHHQESLKRAPTTQAPSRSSLCFLWSTHRALTVTFSTLQSALQCLDSLGNFLQQTLKCSVSWELGLCSCWFDLVTPGLGHVPVVCFQD